MKTKTLSIGTTGSQVRKFRQLEQKLARHAHGLVKTAAGTGTTDQRIKRFQTELFATLLYHRFDTRRCLGNCFVHRDPQFRAIVLRRI